MTGQGQQEARTQGSQGEDRKVLFLSDLARRWGCSERTLMRRHKAGMLPVAPLRNLDHRLRFSLAEVEAYERGRTR